MSVLSQTWRTDAACALPSSGKWEDSDFDLSWKAPADMPKSVRARAVCNGCPVKAECLADALHDEDGGGIRMRSMMRGGMTPQERFEHDEQNGNLR